MMRVRWQRESDLTRLRRDTHPLEYGHFIVVLGRDSFGAQADE